MMMANENAVGFAEPLHTRRPPAHGGRYQVGKVRRPIGDPVAVPKEPLGFEPPPPPTTANFHLSLDTVAPDASARAEANKKLVFHCVGDTGGVHGDDVQTAIADEMERQVNQATEEARPAFFYPWADVVYFKGLSRVNRGHFNEPYQYYPAPIFAIPGNHDGSTRVSRGDPPDPETTLTGFIRNFCDTAPRAAG